MEAIERALDHATLARKLRCYVRENGDGLGGLLKLADAHSERARALLDEVGQTAKYAGEPPLARPAGETGA